MTEDLTTPADAVIPEVDERTKGIELNIANMISSAQDALFERFDNLHKSGVTDTDVIRALRELGEEDMATDYIEWADAIDPDADGAPYSQAEVTEGAVIAEEARLAKELDS